MDLHAFSNVPFGVLSDIIEDLNELRDSLLIAGNLQPPYDTAYWQRASDLYISITKRVNSFNGG